MTDIESRPTATDYQQILRVRAGAQALFDALTDPAGLASWWTRVTGSGEAGGELRFYFDSPENPCVMRVDEATRPTSVRWTVTACGFLPDWVGTRPTFAITPIDAGAAELRFRHEGLTAELDCIDQCTSGWNHFLESLRRYAETGRGMPFGSEADAARRLR
ncbi:SRPBCC domain-containing protein [Plantactinospora siamensis]|uniref:SRPBCC domain-containing protein n=1 Tax=Plantactinospora siamensis TaxID=555372 RepID=A0ABV6NZ97_9ACTN